MAERRREELNGYIWHLIHAAPEVAEVGGCLCSWPSLALVGGWGMRTEAGGNHGGDLAFLGLTVCRKRWVGRGSSPTGLCTEMQ